MTKKNLGCGQILSALFRPLGTITPGYLILLFWTNLRTLAIKFYDAPTTGFFCHLFTKMTIILVGIGLQASDFRSFFDQNPEASSTDKS